MEAFREFFILNWRIIVVCLLYLILLICSLIRKRTSSDLLDKLFLQVVNHLPGYINMVEMPGNGSDKKSSVISLCIDNLSHLLGRNLTVDELEFYSNKFSELIEDILSTPVKKGVNL